MEKIILASNNSHKIKEFSEILKGSEILTLNDIGFAGDIEETGTTFLENALIKAKAVSAFLKEKNMSATVIADDSGLCVEALGGEPGVYSARYSGEHGNGSENRKKLLEKMEGETNRKAYFVCCLVKYFPDNTFVHVEGKTFGQIATEEHGSTSFGYDSLFLSDDLKKSFGEATSEEKNSVSHRNRAIHLLMQAK